MNKRTIHTRSLLTGLWIIWLTVTCAGHAYTQTTDTLSLNGYWKFHTFLGDGSNYLGIQPEAGDLIIDNRQTDLIEQAGKWSLQTNAERTSTCWDADYLRHYFTNARDEAYVRFRTQVPESGYYEHFVYYPWSHHAAAKVKVVHAEGAYTTHMSQRNLPSVWTSLGIFKVEKGGKGYIEISSSSKGTASADAVMLRPIEPATFLRERSLRDQAHLAEFDDQSWQTLKVPGHWGMINEYANYSGKAWYRTHIDLPEDWKHANDERIRLRFEGVYHLAKVYVNGQFVGQNRGGFTPFEFEVSHQLNADGPNVIAVEADNNYFVGATWNWGGIIRDVRLIKSKDVRIQHQYIHAEPDLVTGTATYDIQVRVENNSAAQRSLILEAVITKGEQLSTIQKKIQLPSHSIQTFELSDSLSADQVKLWHFDRPELYRLQTQLKEGQEVLHQRADRFGIRKFEVTATQMLLNGEPVRLVGFNRVSDHRYWGSSEPQELIDFDVDMMKLAGANMMRIMHGTQNEKLIERCDEKGILIFEEVNVRDLRNPEFTSPDYPLVKTWMKAMIERDMNHPCVVGWSVGNELQDHFHYVKSLYEYTKCLDPHRLALHVSNRGYQKGESPENNPLAYGDMIFQNIYQKDPGAVMDTLHARWPDQAMFFSEFGVQRFTSPSLDHDIPGLATFYEYLRQQRPYTTGASIWTYNDYKSGYTQSLPSQNRAWGMVNAWRTKRRAFYTHRAENSPLKKMEIEGLDLRKRKATVSLQIRAEDGFPSYSLRGYKLKYVFRDRVGEELLQSETDLPILSPGMEARTFDLNWPSFAGKPYSFEVALMTPNGCDRHLEQVYFSIPDRPEINEVKSSGTKIRVHFTPQTDAFEYQVRYQVEGQVFFSSKTIAPYVELDSLPPRTELSIQLIAWNKQGSSKKSSPIKVITEGMSLAPIVWDAFIADHRLVIGYSGEWEDEQYTVKYGQSPQTLDQTASTNARGMMTIEVDGESSLFFQIKRTTHEGESQWSPVYEAKTGTFRMYE
ncbi:MAG: glycoside hydrolase family 2 TIM barrel-domain containing protein [Bacteroidota bacterium]